MTKWATSEDYAVCRELHRKFGTTYYLASRFFPAAQRQRVDAVYGFVRVADEWVDNPKFDDTDARERLRQFRRELQEGLEGKRPSHPVLRAFVDVARETGLALNEPFLFLDAMEADLDVVRYPRYQDLERYMRGSAAAVGLMLMDVLGIQRTPTITEGSMALSEAMQLTNFIRDVGEDLRRGRIYLPLEDMDRFGVVEEDLYNQRVSSEFVQLLQFEIRRAQELYRQADLVIPELPLHVRRPVRLARILYSRILDRVAQANYDVFHRRARTTTVEKALASVRVMLTK